MNKEAKEFIVLETSQKNSFQAIQSSQYHQSIVRAFA